MRQAAKMTIAPPNMLSTKTLCTSQPQHKLLASQENIMIARNQFRMSLLKSNETTNDSLKRVMPVKAK